jgi:hypothetical protein
MRSESLLPLPRTPENQVCEPRSEPTVAITDVAADEVACAAGRGHDVSHLFARSL